MQLPNVVGLLYEGGGFRQFYLDGRTLPKDPNPTWYGYSVGRWDGETLVVETAGFNDRSWLDESGHPHSEDLHIAERFRRIDFGHIQFQITFDDPKTLTRPLTRSLPIPHVTTSLQRDLLQLSKRSCQIVATNSHHAIPFEAPDFVVRAVRVTIEAWQNSSTPNCS